MRSMRRWPLVSVLAGAAVLAGRALAAHDQLDADVLIIGAGQAGMSAAYQLRKRGLTVRVLEATDHVGGRTRNIDVATGKMDVETDDVIEVGGTWLSPDHSAAMELCSELGIEVYNASFVPDLEVTSVPKEEMPWWYWGSDYPTEQRQRLKRSIVHTSTGRHVFTTASELQAALPSQSTASLKRVGAFVDGRAAEISDRCWLDSGMSRAWREADTDTTWGALGGKLEGKDAEQVLRNCIHGKNAQEPEAVSFLYNLLSFKGCNSKGADSQYRVRGGTQAIPLKIAAQLGNSVLLGHEVRSIKADGGDVEIQVRGGKSFRARAAILTGPPPAVLGISFNPPLTGTDAQWLQRMPMGTSLKLAAIYKEGPWWRELGLQGEILSTLLPPKLSLPAPDTDLPLFVQCMDHSPYSQRIGVIVCFVEGRQNFHFLQMSQNDQQERFVEFLAMSFNSSKAKTLKPSFVAHNWADQPFARGAYTGFFSPGVMSVPEFWSAFQQMEKLPNVFLAGSDYHIGFGNGYIEGALRDGESAARRVADLLQRVMHV